MKNVFLDSVLWLSPPKRADSPKIVGDFAVRNQPKFQKKGSFHNAKAMVIIMKAFIASCVVLAIVISLSLLISLKVTKVCDEIYLLAGSFPADCKDEQAVERLSEIDKIWKDNYNIFKFTVRRELVLSMDICISNLHAVVTSDEDTDYISHIKTLMVTVDAIISSERPSLESIL